MKCGYSLFLLLTCLLYFFKLSYIAYYSKLVSDFLPIFLPLVMIVSHFPLESFPVFDTYIVCIMTYLTMLLTRRY